MKHIHSCSTSVVHRVAEMAFKVVKQRGSAHHTVQLSVKIFKFQCKRKQHGQMGYSFCCDIE